MNLIEGALGYLDARVIQKASALVGESPASTRRGLDAAVPAVVAALAGAATVPAGARAILGALEDAGLRDTQERVAERLYSLSGDELLALGRDLLARVFGGRLRGIVQAAAGATGVRPDAMTSLFCLAAPLVSGVLGSALHARHLDAAGLVGLLGAQRAVASSTLPPTVVAAIADIESPRAGAPAPPLAAGRTSRDRFWPLLLVVPLAIMGGMFLRRRSVPDTEPWVPARGLGVGVMPREAPPPVLEPTPAAVGPQAEPQGTASGERVVVDEVSEFLASDTAPPERRFVFEDLNFELATTDLTPASIPTLDRLAEALRAHPGARIRIEGHTDTTGNPADNARLALRRAEAVRDALVARGVSADCIETAGAGETRPLAPNDTAQGRARNRRTEVVITR